MNDVGKKIQAYRQKSGLTQEALAEKLDISRQSVSKWELGQTLPEVDKIMAMSRLFSITTDELLHMSPEPTVRRDLLRLGSIYLIVQDMQKSINFYESLLTMRVSTLHPMFAEFFFDNHCIALMDNARIAGHNVINHGDHKFVFNFNIQDLLAEHMRLKNLQIGSLTEIMQAHSDYYYFQIRDPDNNVIEITGQVYDTRRNNQMETIYCQSCAMPMKEEQYGSLKDGAKTNEYCHYCMKDGNFTTEQTLDEAIEGNIQFWLADCNNDPEQARKRIREVFTTLKRWK